MKQTVTNGQLLRRAADEMERRGHARCFLVITPDRHRASPELGRIGAVCLQGAINVAVTGDPVEWPVQAGSLRRAVARYLGVHDVISWNNEPERTQAEMVAALRGAADMVDSEEKRA